MVKILFLDVDGVLNNWTLLEKQGIYALGDHQIEELCRIIKKTGAEIVLSSTWRKYPEAVEKLEEKLSPLNIKDHTKVLSPIGGWKLDCSDVPRHREIQEWLDRHPEVDDFVILDDEPDASIDGHFFRTDINGEGLTSGIADQVIEHFEKN